MSKKPTNDTLATALAAKAFRRRSFLQGGAAAAGFLIAGPAIVRDAFSSSGELNWFTWEDYAPKPLMDKFTKDTGIKINVTVFSSNEEQLNKLRAARGEGFDLCTPTITWAAAHNDVGNIQGLDEKKIANLGNMNQTFYKKVDELGGRAGGRLLALPYKWGTEAIAFNTKSVKVDYPTASFGDLWNPAYKGKMTCRPRSIMLGAGLWMEGEGKLPKGTMFKAYTDEAAFTLGYGTAVEFAIKNKAQIAKFWAGTADTQAAFLQDGCVIGQTWDGPINTMANEGHPFRYLSPKEGALTWVDALALPKGAKNIEQAYAFANWAMQAPVGGLMADETGYNSVVTGAEKFTKPAYTKNFNSAYPEDAISKLWFQGAESTSFIAKRQELATKLQAA